MLRFENEGIEVWAGVHAAMGAVVCDPCFQRDVPEDKLRLYVWSQQRLVTFKASIALDRLVDERSEPQLSDIVNDYFAQRRK